MNFADELRDLGACEEAVTWVGDRTLPQAWWDCENSEWMWWLLAKKTGSPGWPGREDFIVAARAAANAAYAADAARAVRYFDHCAFIRQHLTPEAAKCRKMP